MNVLRAFGAVPNDLGVDNGPIVQKIIDRARDGSTLKFPAGDYRFASGFALHNRQGVTLRLERGARFIFLDGDYVGVTVANESHRCAILGGQLRGTNALNPLLTLVKLTSNAAYFDLDRVDMHGARTAVRLAKCYIVKLRGNRYSGCFTYVDNAGGEGGATDILLDGETYGTAINSGTDPLVRIAGNGVRLVNGFFETQVTAAKYSVEFLTGCQQSGIGGVTQFSNSGGVVARTSTDVSMKGAQFNDCGRTPLPHVLRWDGGAEGICEGNGIAFPAPGRTMPQAISASGGVTITGNRIKRAIVGVGVSSASIVRDNVLAGCVTPISDTSRGLAQIGPNLIT